MRSRKLLQILQALGLGCALLLLIALPEVAAGAAQDGLALCAKVMLPSLFPFFVCSQLFLQLGFAARLSRLLSRPVSRLLRLPVQAGSAFVLGLFGGYPAGAQIACGLYEKKLLTRQEAERALAVCNQAGPSFIFGVLGGAVFGSAAAGAFLYGVQLLSAVLVCRLSGRECQENTAAALPPQAPDVSFAAAFSEAVRRAGLSAVQVCMFVTVFSVLSRFLLLAIGTWLPGQALPLALGAMELSAGCAALGSCDLPILWKLCLASALLSFGGCSVLAQSRAVAADAGLQGKLLVPCKLLQAAVSAALSLLFASLLHAEAWCIPAAAPVSSPIQTAGSCVLLLCTMLCMYFRKVTHSIPARHRV